MLSCNAYALPDNRYNSVLLCEVCTHYTLLYFNTTQRSTFFKNKKIYTSTFFFNMSTTSKVVFGLSCIVSVGIIGFVHYQQQDDLNKLHEGVIKDIERQEHRRLQLEINDIPVNINLQDGKKIA